MHNRRHDVRSSHPAHFLTSAAARERPLGLGQRGTGRSQVRSIVLRKPDLWYLSGMIANFVEQGYELTLQCPLLMPWTAPHPASECHDVVAVEATTIQVEPPMEKITTVGLDIAKSVFRCMTLTHKATWSFVGN